MNKRIKKLWIKALRSGKYTKCRGFLHSKSEFCVIGVLCDLYPGMKWTKETEQSASRAYGELYSPPQTILDWANLHNENISDLVAKNDIERLSFDKMADWIEENL